MLVASIAVFALVSTLVAFGAWPGVGTGPQVDQVLLNDAVKAKPKPVTVRADAVAVARGDVRRREVAGHAARQGAQKRTIARTRSGTPIARAPGKSSPAGSQPATSGSPSVAGTPVAQVPANAVPAPVKQGTQNVTQTVGDTTQQIAGQVTQPVQSVTDPVGQVVDQVAAPVQQTAAPVVQQVQGTTGSVPPH
jgi:hypothetical protein